MSAPHFVFVGYASSAEQALGEWLASSALVEGIHSAEPPRPGAMLAGHSARPVIGWRMIAANGRELARSVGMFIDKTLQLTGQLNDSHVTALLDLARKRQAEPIDLADDRKAEDEDE